jgi:hypothetical protein
VEFVLPFWIGLYTFVYFKQFYYHRGCRGRDRMAVGVASSNPGHVIKFVSDLRQVGGFLMVLWFPPPIKLTIAI